MRATPTMASQRRGTLQAKRDREVSGARDARRTTHHARAMVLQAAREARTAAATAEHARTVAARRQAQPQDVSDRSVQRALQAIERGDE
jgi:hypothetical protein